MGQRSQGLNRNSEREGLCGEDHTSEEEDRFAVVLFYFGQKEVPLCAE